MWNKALNIPLKTPNHIHFLFWMSSGLILILTFVLWSLLGLREMRHQWHHSLTSVLTIEKILEEDTLSSIETALKSHSQVDSVQVVLGNNPKLKVFFRHATLEDRRKIYAFIKKKYMLCQMAQEEKELEHTLTLAQHSLGWSYFGTLVGSLFSLVLWSYSLSSAFRLHHSTLEVLIVLGTSFPMIRAQLYRYFWSFWTKGALNAVGLIMLATTCMRYVWGHTPFIFLGWQSFLGVYGTLFLWGSVWVHRMCVKRLSF